MKTKFIIFSGTILLIGLLYASANASTNTKRISLFSHSKLFFPTYDKYAVTGYTRNEFGTNYSISLRVTGNSNSLYSYISYVEYNNGYQWVRVSHYAAFGEEYTYYVSVDYKKYYFVF